MSVKLELTDRIKKELRNGEEVIWAGKPKDFALMSEEVKSSFFTRWIVCAVVAVALLVVYFIANANAEQGVKSGIIILCLLVPIYLACLPVLDKRNILKNCKYYVTDKRVIIDHAEKEFYSINKSCLRSEIVENEGGTITVMLGSLAGMKAGKRRSKAVIPDKDDGGVVTGLVIYNVDADAKNYFAF